jgi:hypothetical protein
MQTALIILLAPCGLLVALGIRRLARRLRRPSHVRELTDRVNAIFDEPVCERSIMKKRLWEALDASKAYGIPLKEAGFNGDETKLAHEVAQLIHHHEVEAFSSSNK